jgi:hypothetical protein
LNRGTAHLLQNFGIKIPELLWSNIPPISQRNYFLWPTQKATGEIRRKWEDVFRVFESAFKSRLETGSWLPGMMSMRDNVLPRQRILELYLRTAVQKRHARFSAVSPCIFVTSQQFPLSKRLRKVNLDLQNASCNFQNLRKQHPTHGI